MLHPDEGLIHAWLDGQLPPEEAARVEQLVATDAAWGEAAAEARGLVAASSRILASLDDVPRGVLPASNRSPALRRLPWWTKAAAAVVVIAGASTLVLQRAPEPKLASLPATSVQAPTSPVVPVPASPKQTQPVPVSPKQTQPGSANPAKSLAVVATKDERSVSSTANAPSQQAQRPATALEGMQVTGVAAPRDSARALEQRATEQRAEAAERQVTDAISRDAAGGAGARRVAAALPAAKATTQSVVNQATKSLAPAPVAATIVVAACYGMRDSRTSTATGIVMRGERQVGDTLFLAPLHPTSPARGWVVTRDGALRGVLTTEPEGRGMLLVTATQVPCASP